MSDYNKSISEMWNGFLKHFSHEICAWLAHGCRRGLIFRGLGETSQIRLKNWGHFPLQSELMPKKAFSCKMMEQRRLEASRDPGAKCVNGALFATISNLITKKRSSNLKMTSEMRVSWSGSSTCSNLKTALMVYLWFLNIPASCPRFFNKVADSALMSVENWRHLNSGESPGCALELATKSKH